MQDNLSGVENPVSVKVLQIPDETYEVVHSLAKWNAILWLVLVSVREKVFLST